MVPEQATLEILFADFYRTSGETERVASQAGLDPSKISLSNSSPAAMWHMVVTAALQDNRLSDLYAIAQKEHPRNVDLKAAWKAYEAATVKPVRRSAASSPRGQPGDSVSDYRAEERRDARVDQMQRDLTDMRIAVASLTRDMAALSKQNDLILSLLDERSAHIELPHSIQWYAAAFIVIAAVIYFLVYYGGNQ